MATITLKGNPLKTSGTLPTVGSQAPDFTLTKTNLSDVSLADFRGKRIILNIFPSVDTGTCAASVRAFNARAEKIENTVVLCISNDLPFAQQRFCAAEGLENVVSLSGFRHKGFEQAYGVRIEEGGMAGLMARAVVVIDEQGRVVHAEQVEELVNEPDYEAAIKALGQ
jgi:thiol peroxidase